MLTDGAWGFSPTKSRHELNWPSDRGLNRLRKNSGMAHFLKRQDFSRAANATKEMLGFSPCGTVFGIFDFHHSLLRRGRRFSAGGNYTLAGARMAARAAVRPVFSACCASGVNFSPWLVR